MPTPKERARGSQNKEGGDNGGNLDWEGVREKGKGGIRNKEGRKMGRIEAGKGKWEGLRLGREDGKD